MDELQGLLVSITEGLSFPKKKVYLSIRYSKYIVTFPVVSGGDKTVFNQGYFFRNVKMSGHDESNLPVLIEAFEKRGLLKDVLIAKLRVEAFNFYKYDYYEPLHFCLTPENGYNAFEFQLKILFQFVKPSSQFSLSKSIDTSHMKPIAYHIEILSSSLNETLVDKQLYYSCKLIINNNDFLKTRDIKGIEPQWKQCQTVAACDFSNPKMMLFQINHVTYPQRQDTMKQVGEARLTFKRIATLNTNHFNIAITGSRKEIGRLHLVIQPLYAQSRDTTADKENVYQLQPNVFPPSLDMTPASVSKAVAKQEAPVNPLTGTIVADTGTVVKPVLRENARLTSASLSGTIRSLSPSQSNTIRLSQASAIQQALVGEGLGEMVIDSVNSTPRQVLSNSVSPRQMNISHDSERSSVSSASLKDVTSNRTEIKRVASPVLMYPVSRDGYVSGCKAIVLKSEYKSADQGFRLIPRMKNDYVERMKFVW